LTYTSHSTDFWSKNGYISANTYRRMLKLSVNVMVDIELWIMQYQVDLNALSLWSMQFRSAIINNPWRAWLHQRVQKPNGCYSMQISVKYAMTTLFEHISVLVNVQQSPTVMEVLCYSYCTCLLISMRLSYTEIFRSIGTRVMDLAV
jgi:hypothetical protein